MRETIIRKIKFQVLNKISYWPPLIQLQIKREYNINYNLKNLVMTIADLINCNTKLLFCRLRNTNATDYQSLCARPQHLIRITMLRNINVRRWLIRVQYTGKYALQKFKVYNKRNVFTFKYNRQKTLCIILMK